MRGSRCAGLFGLRRVENELWSVIPDGLFALSFADGTAAYFLLEIDRGTIPIVRNSLDHRSITRKLATYWEGWKARQHETQFGVKQMRVAMVTSSRKRIEHMLAIVRELNGREGERLLSLHRPRIAERKWAASRRMEDREARKRVTSGLRHSNPEGLGQTDACKYVFYFPEFVLKRA